LFDQTHVSSHVFRITLSYITLGLAIPQKQALGSIFMVLMSF